MIKRIEVKCPVCGNEEFIEIGQPYHCGMDTYIDDMTSYFACSLCGLVLRFAPEIVQGLLEREYLETDNGKKWSSLNRELKNLLSSISMLENNNKDLRERLKDDSRSVASDKQMKNELKENQSKLQAFKKKALEIEKEMEKLRK